MGLNAVKILKISITNNSKKEILEEIQKYLDARGKNQKKSLKIFTPNTEQLVRAERDSHFADILNQADVAIPDTVGVVWAGHVLTKNDPAKRIAGVEFMEDLVRLAANRHVPIGLIGGRGNLAIDTLNCLQQKYPGLSGWAAAAPEFRIANDDLRFMNYENRNPDHNNHKSLFINHNSKKSQYFEMLAKRIIKSSVRIVFVALGPPKQEYFIARLARELSFRPEHVPSLLEGSRNPNRIPKQVRDDKSSVILMAVGGSFDILSGRLPRSPLLLRKMGLEWFWRLLLEPQRIARQLALIKFVLLVFREKLSGR